MYKLAHSRVYTEPLKGLEAEAVMERVLLLSQVIPFLCVRDILHFCLARTCFSEDTGGTRTRLSSAGVFAADVRAARRAVS